MMNNEEKCEEEDKIIIACLFAALTALHMLENGWRQECMMEQKHRKHLLVQDPFSAHCASRS
jgi:hypothetical protein